MSQLHSGSLQGMLFSTPFLFNICSKLLHLESISRAWVSCVGLEGLQQTSDPVSQEEKPLPPSLPAAP